MKNQTQALEYASVMQYCKAVRMPTVGTNFVPLAECAPVKRWLEEHNNLIEVFYPPSYSPELNPDGRLNGDLKQAIETRVPCRTKDKLRQAQMCT